jgi:hypothetical protein
MSNRRLPRRIMAAFAVLAAVALALPASARAQTATASDQTGEPRIPAASSTGEPGSGEPAWIGPSTPEVPGERKFTDISSWKWAADAIRYVGTTHAWMRDYGTDKFRPGLIETRAYFAQAMVKAYGGGESPDPSINISDMDKSNTFYDDANIAIKMGWMSRAEGDKFLPNDPVTIPTVYQALVRSLPLNAEEHGLNNLHTADGYNFDVPPKFATTELGMRLGLRYNHSAEGKDLDPSDPMPRAEVAYALWRRATVPPSTVSDLSIYQDIQLPALDVQMRKVVQFGMDYVGYPYIWGGEWFRKNSSQPTGGFDCSGFTWWTMKRPVPGYDNTKIRGYKGWSIPQRTSADMASQGKRISYKDAKAGDLMFYDGNNDGIVDHVDMFIGSGWALDSSSGVGGVTILRVTNSWYEDHFKHARDIGA